MQIILVAAFLITVATMACASPAATLESDSGSSSQQPEESGPVLLLDGESAISILQTYLQECVIGWDEAYEGQQRSRDSGIYRGQFSRRSGTVFPTNTPRPPDQYQLPLSEQETKKLSQNSSERPTRHPRESGDPGPRIHNLPSRNPGERPSPA